jgi:hypothetical protein
MTWNCDESTDSAPEPFYSFDIQSRTASRHRRRIHYTCMGALQWGRPLLLESTLITRRPSRPSGSCGRSRSTTAGCSSRRSSRWRRFAPPCCWPGSRRSTGCWYRAADLISDVPRPSPAKGRGAWRGRSLPLALVFPVPPACLVPLPSSGYSCAKASVRACTWVSQGMRAARCADTPGSSTAARCCWAEAISLASAA